MCIRDRVHSEVVDTNGSGHGALAGVLNALNADVLICGGLGGGAQIALAAAGIKPVSYTHLDVYKRQDCK